MIGKADIRRVQEWMCHAHIQTTMKYLHYAPREGDAALVAEAKQRLKIGGTMKLPFSDYDGPTGLLIATGKELLPLDSVAGATAFVGAGMLAGTIDPEESGQIQAAVNSGGADSATIVRQKEKTRPTRGRVV
jgi:hypothetical protein